MSRGLRLSIVLAAVVATGGCSAIDNFNDFRFTDGGSAGGAGGGDLATVSAIGDACPTGSCTGGLTCFTQTEKSTFAGGLCSQTCDPQRQGGCPTGALCAQVDNVALCLRACDGSLVTSCRVQYSCCASQHVVTGAGLCAPTVSNFCGN